jgi:hypothetical protein
LNLVLDAELSAKRNLEAIGSLEKTHYTNFGIINYQEQELRKLYRKTKKLLTSHGQHHPKADIDRLFVSRKQR